MTTGIENSPGLHRASWQQEFIILKVPKKGWVLLGNKPIEFQDSLASSRLFFSFQAKHLFLYPTYKSEMK